MANKLITVLYKKLITGDLATLYLYSPLRLQGASKAMEKLMV
jgi:hypothetical protein